MTRPKSQYSRNMRELDRANVALERVLEHIFIIDQSYEARINYDKSRAMPSDEITLNVKTATVYIAEEIGKLQTLIGVMKEQITNG